MQQKKNQPKMGVGGTRSGNRLHKPTLRFCTCFSVPPLCLQLQEALVTPCPPAFALPGGALSSAPE